ncbi:hypothetical protein G6F31_021040 [Rhizopus arrhizus]|nr:hypothetical protein G6F32_017025 [Rhizopus arrhizus]KAG0919630.1 hypothetical protein G6F31_021040 [Rhizopus arrhizus]
MEAGHHHAPGFALDDHRLHVHRAVHRPHRGTEHEQHQSQQPGRVGQHQPWHAEADQQRAGHHHPTAAQARGEHAGQRHRQQRTGAQAEQHQAQRGIVDVRA